MIARLSALLAAAAAITPIAKAVPAVPKPLIVGREVIPPGYAFETNLPCLPTNLTYPYPESGINTEQTGDNCNEFGHPPAPKVSIVQGPLQLQDLVDICRGEIVDLTDNLGDRRQACLYVNQNSTPDKPLPLLVWLHPSAVSASNSFPLTGIHEARETEPLNDEDASRLGYSYILPFGRTTVHQYPLADRYTPGWDNWYRNLDRSSSSLNADVDLIDKAIVLAKERAVVDERRVFMSGWSNGAAMALLYSLNTEGIASTSVYSAPDPYRDAQDPCTQVPFPSVATPTQDVHNFCDIIGICTTGQYFYQDLKDRYSNLKQSFVVVDTFTAAVKSQDGASECDMNCQGTCLTVQGTAAHLRWPVTRNSDTFFKFLRENPLPSSGSHGAPS